MLLATYSELCRDDTFGPGVPSIAECRGGFDFTITFEESVFSLAPACLLLIVSPWRLYYLRRSTPKTTKSWIHLWSLPVFLVLGALQATLVALFSQEHAEYCSLLIASSTLQLCATIVLTLLSHSEHRNAVRPSMVISSYLISTSILDAARARTHGLMPGRSTVTGVLIAIVLLKVVAVALETRQKTSVLSSEYCALSPESRSNIFSRAFFLWLNPVLSMGFRGVISSQDLPTIYEKLTSEDLATRVRSGWIKREKKGNNALMYHVLLSFPYELFLVFVGSTALVGLNICYPFLIQEAVAFLESPHASLNVGYGLIGGFFCVSLAVALIIPFIFQILFRVMIMTRGVLIPMIYSKLLENKGNAVDQSTAFTLMTTDVEKIVETFFLLIMTPWESFLQIGICTYLLYRLLGAVCCVPIITILASFVLVGLAGFRVPEHQNTWFQEVDSRVKMTSHILSSMHSVKLLGLSREMEELIQKKRTHELGVSQKFRLSNCLALTASYFPAILGPLATLGTYAIARMLSDESSLSVTKAVASLSILNLITTPARRLLFVIPLGLQSVGSFSRIQKFLQYEKDTEETVNSNFNDSEQDVSEKTVDSESKFMLATPQHMSEADTFFAPAKFTAITGPIGCGKSTLLKALLSKTSSRLDLSTDIAYCGQTPWIHDGTIRDNIVGASDLDALWYKEVVHSCELDFDLTRMPDGDATAVGSGGQRLSGGQRQRIAIARALYAQKTKAIFDDVTNALDARTLRAVVGKVFGRDGALRSKGTAVIFATHSSQLLQAADEVILMNRHGGIADRGTYEQLSKHHLIGEKKDPQATSSSREDNVQLGEEVSLGEYQNELLTRLDDMRRQKGDWKSYVFYIGSIGWPNFFLFLFGAIVYVVFIAFFQIWVTKWAADTTGRHGLGYWLGLYGTWAVLIVAALFGTPLLFFSRLVPKSSEQIHSNLLAAALRAPMSFISKIEAGSLVNRFSQDIRLIDWQLPFNMILFVFELLGFFASLGIAVAAVKYIAIGIPVIGSVLYILQLFYLRTSRQLRLLEIETKAPVVSLFLDTVQGLTTIQAFGWGSEFARRGQKLLNDSQKPLYLLFCVQRWLLLVLSLVAMGLQVLVMGLAVALRTSVSPGLVGLAIVQVTTFSDVMSNLILQWTEMETSLGAVTRISRFTKETPQEPQTNELTGLLKEWPASNSVTLEHVSASYDPETNSSLVLDNISLVVQPGEHVGICGRTGSGKSSLIGALACLLPLFRGRILINTSDISTLVPEQVRSKLNLVTQEPFLFEGTFRDNASPWKDIVSDEDIIRALERVDLWTKIQSQGGLDAPLDEASLSHGQRQLFCLARALLRKSGILILDEPTSQIDPATDITIQAVIKEDFSERTVIMIAHRLQSLIDFDRVFVLDSGRLVEDGPPKDLLNDERSAFRALYYHSNSGSNAVQI